MTELDFVIVFLLVWVRINIFRSNDKASYDLEYFPPCDNLVPKLKHFLEMTEKENTSTKH